MITRGVSVAVSLVRATGSPRGRAPSVPLVSVDPVAQRPTVDSRFSGNLRDRLTVSRTSCTAPSLKS